jgi:hypothetical protein
VPVEIDSCGGDVYALLSMISAIDACPVPVATIVSGLAASAAACLFMCGHAGHRFMGPHARLMIHSVSTSVFGTVKSADMAANAAESRRVNDVLCDIMASRCGQPKSYFSSMIRNQDNADVYIGAADAIRMNIASAIGLPAFVTTVSVESVFGLPNAATAIAATHTDLPATSVSSATSRTTAAPAVVVDALAAARKSPVGVAPPGHAHRQQTPPVDPTLCVAGRTTRRKQKGRRQVLPLVPCVTQPVLHSAASSAPMVAASAQGNEPFWGSVAPVDCGHDMSRAHPALDRVTPVAVQNTGSSSEVAGGLLSSNGSAGQHVAASDQNQTQSELGSVPLPEIQPPRDGPLQDCTVPPHGAAASHTTQHTRGIGMRPRGRGHVASVADAHQPKRQRQRGSMATPALATPTSRAPATECATDAGSTRTQPMPSALLTRSGIIPLNGLPAPTAAPTFEPTVVATARAEPPGEGDRDVEYRRSCAESGDA